MVIMIRFKRLAREEAGARITKGKGIYIGASRLAVDIGQNPAVLIRAGDGSLGAVICLDETGSHFKKKAFDLFQRALKKFRLVGKNTGELEVAIVGGSDKAKWKINKWRAAISGEGISATELDLNGLFYRKLYFEPRTGFVNIHKTQVDKNHWNPASANLSLDDGMRVFKDRQAGGVVANATRFFREKHTFTALRELIVPEHLRLSPDKPLLLWLAACSNGAEVYSYAMYVQRLLTRARAHCSFKALGTDINGELIETARNGVYDLSANDLKNYKRYFETYGKLQGKTVRFSEEIRSHLSFKVFNIKKRPPRSRFNVVICANMFQYYDEAAREHFLANFRAATTNPGYIFVGPVSKKIADRLELTYLSKYKMFRVE